MPAAFNETHLNKFKEICNEKKFTDDKVGTGKRLKNWHQIVFREESAILPEESVNRCTLKEICKKDSGFSPTEVFSAVMAWGDMRVTNGLATARWGEKQICQNVQDLRESKLNRKEAFNKFQSLRKDKKLYGMSAAYFTKLIFFCHPDHNGYIMDQWTGRSINLLLGDNIIDFKNTSEITDKNSGEDYEKFCATIEDLSSRVTLKSEQGGPSKAEQVELCLYSGNKNDAWRRYLKGEKIKEQERKKARREKRTEGKKKSGG